jgi:hypothetical protein
MGGETGIEPKKEKFLQDYKPDFEYAKRPLSRGGGKPIFKHFEIIAINFEKQPDRPPLHKKCSYSGAASEYQHLYDVND